MPLLPACLKQACTLATWTPGVGTCEPSRKTATISSTNSSFLRRSGVRKALANAPSNSGPLLVDQALDVRDGAVRGVFRRPRRGSLTYRCSPDVRSTGEDPRHSCVVEPPAAAILAAALSENLCALTWTATEISPWPRTLTGWPSRTAPLATRSSTL